MTEAGDRGSGVGRAGGQGSRQGAGGQSRKQGAMAGRRQGTMAARQWPGKCRAIDNEHMTE